MVRLAIQELIERLDITIEVLKNTNTAGVESLIEAVVLCKEIMQHYVKPFSLQSTEALKKHMTDMDKP
jgi:hypothetical protein